MRTIIAVLRGGPSVYADTSLASGAAVLNALNLEQYEPRDVFISPEGYWYQEGLPMQPERALRDCPIVINCIPGRYGQDGWLDRLIEKLGHKTVGSRPGPLALSFHKDKTKLVALRLQLQVPAHREVSKEDDIDAAALDIFRSFAMPATVVPNGGSFLHESPIIVALPELRDALTIALEHSPKALVEEHIAGEPISVGIVEERPGKSHYGFVLTSAVPGANELAIEAAQRLHHHLGLSHFSQSDFIVNPRGLWYQHTNAMPPLHAQSPFVQGLTNNGMPLPEFLDHSIALAQK